MSYENLTTNAQNGSDVNGTMLGTLIATLSNLIQVQSTKNGGLTVRLFRAPQHSTSPCMQLMRLKSYPEVYG